MTSAVSMTIKRAADFFAPRQMICSAKLPAYTDFLFIFARLNPKSINFKTIAI